MAYITVTLRRLAAGLAVNTLLLGVPMAQSRPFDLPPEAPRLGAHAQRCLAMATGRSVRQFAFEAPAPRDATPAAGAERLARAADLARARCQAALETA